MEFIRYIILCLILMGSTSIGFLISKKYTDRVKQLKAFLSSTKTLQTKIKFTKEPLPEIFEYISKTVSYPISIFFKEVSNNIKTQEISKVWNSTLKTLEKNSDLTNEDIEIIKDLGNNLGKTDTDGELSQLQLFESLIQNQINKAEIEENKNKKMYRTLRNSCRTCYSNYLNINLFNFELN